MRHLLLALTCVAVFASPAFARETEGKSSGTVDGVGYRVVPGRTTFSPAKGEWCRMRVELSKRATLKTVRSLSRKLHKQGLHLYKKSVIDYVLPNPAIFDPSWAIARFDPALTVKIEGLTPKELKALLAVPVKTSGKIIGRWLFSRVSGTKRVAFIREGKALFLETVFKDGKPRRQPVTRRRVKGGVRIDSVPPSGHGEYHLLLANGRLESRDGEGLIAAGKILK